MYLFVADDNSAQQRAGTAKRIWLQDKSGFVQRRKHAKIIRFRHFSKTNEPKEYYRERLMLFLPWRDETVELDQVEDTRKKYQENVETITSNSREYFHDFNFDEELLRQLVESEEMEDEDDEVVSNELDALEDERYARAEMTEAAEKSSTCLKLKPPKILSREDFCKLMRSLNVTQRQIVNECLHRLKSGKTPFQIFLSGGAGTGKSHVITTIVQAIRHLRFNENGTTPEDIPVMVCAPTGKAAFNVMGMTLHAAFHLGPNQKKYGPYEPLDGSVLNTLRIKLRKTELFVIDEISMASSRQGSWIDKRLQQIYGNDLPFGGKSVLAVGDLRQLPPIPPIYMFYCPDTYMKALIKNINPLWKHFCYFQLDEIMRQKGEYEFCKALNNMAVGQMDADDIKLFRELEVSKSRQPPSEAVFLYLWNQDCAAYNKTYHETLGTDSSMSTATDKISGNQSA